MENKINIVYQTHWDREWYLTFEQYRYRLTQVLDRVFEAIENNEINYFVLDGQVRAIEDYIEVAPADKVEKLKSLIKNNKVIIGPWYVLADEFLVSGESLVRNLEIGIKQAKKFGNCQMVGYLPDTFGHVAQMPQLLSSFKINDAIIWRGITSKNSEFIWEAPDGSKVFTLYLPEGYYQPIVEQPDYINLMRNYINNTKPYAKTSNILLTNGGDHIMPGRADIPKRMKELSNEFPEIEFENTNYEQYFKDIKKELKMEDLETFEGELRQNDKIYVLPNVLSTRNYLKVENQKIEDQITGYTEPLLTLLDKDHNYPYNYLEETWKMLLLNHPHDSICGCSIDEVHQDMDYRNRNLLQRLDMIEKGSLHSSKYLDACLHTSDSNAKVFNDMSEFIVFNPHPYQYCNEINATLYVRKDGELQDFIIVDNDGNEYIPTIISKSEGRSFETPLDYFPEFRNEYFYNITFTVSDFPANSLKQFKLKVGKSKKLETLSQNYIENDFIKVEVINNQVNLYDKVNNKVYNDINKFYSSLDHGDEYTYSKPKDDIVSETYTIENVVVKTIKGTGTLEYTVKLVTPKQLDDTRSTGTKETVINTINVKMAITPSSDRVTVNVNGVNNAMDQRLRVKFPIGEIIEHSLSDSAFSIEKRSIRDEIYECERGYGKEVPVVVDPSQSMIIAKKNRGLVLYHRGLHEYQMVNIDETSILELTLIRSVGWLSRDDMRSRGGGAGPHFATPEGQCVGTFSFDYAIRPYNESITVANYLTGAKLFRNPLRTYKGSLGNEVNENNISISNSEVQWSSIRKIDNDIYIRLWNPNEEESEFIFNTKYPYKKLSIVDMSFNILKEIEEGNLTIAGNNIMTIKISL